MEQPNAADTAEQLIDLRRANSARCAEVVRRGAPATIGEIAQMSGLSRPTVTARLRDLIVDGLVADIGLQATQSAGRPANRFAFVPEARLIAGLELGKHEERLIFIDLSGRERWHGTRAAVAGDADTRLASAAEWVTDTASGLPAPLARICVSVPGSLDATGRFVEMAAFEEWRGMPVPPIVQAAFGVPTDVVHDLGAAMLAEQRMGAAVDVDTFIVPVLWHRVSGGVVVDRVVYSGPRGRAGSPYRMKRLRDADHADDIEWPSAPAVQEIAALAEQGDADAQQSLDRFAALAAEQIAMMQLVIDPDLIVMYGPLTGLDAIVERVRSHLHEQAPDAAPLVVSEFGQYSTVFGCALTALDRAGDDLIGPGLSPLNLDRSGLTWAVGDQRTPLGIS